MYKTLTGYPSQELCGLVAIPEAQLPEPGAGLLKITRNPQADVANIRWQVKVSYEPTRLTLS
jgi:hypothetical protein